MAFLQILAFRRTFKTWNKCKKGMYFSFDFGWYSINFDIVRSEQRGGGGGGGRGGRGGC